MGGFVRDLLLRSENYDIDVVVEGDGIRLARVLAQEETGELRVHKRFGTATLDDILVIYLPVESKSPLTVRIVPN